MKKTIFLLKYLKITASYFAYHTYRHIDRYLKNGVSKSIAHVIYHTNFQLYRVHPDGVL